MSILFVFLDGVGLATAGPDNPLSEANMPHVRSLLGGPLVLETANMPSRERVLLRAIDATLGIEGLPQSGTGQTALFAGFNAAQAHGRHQPHVPPVALRARLAEQSLFRRVIERGGTVAFANAFTPGYWEGLANRRIRRSASVIAAEGAGVRFRDLADLQEGQAMAWDITAASLQARGENIGLIAPEQTGATFARLARAHDFVFYENSMPDLAGHGRMPLSLGEVFTLIDGMLGATLAQIQPGDTLVLTSDHGNAESLAAPSHTRNPVPLLVVGPHVELFRTVQDISEVAGAVLASMDLGRSHHVAS